MTADAAIVEDAGKPLSMNAVEVSITALGAIADCVPG